MLGGEMEWKIKSYKTSIIFFEKEVQLQKQSSSVIGMLKERFVKSKIQTATMFGEMARVE